jgi:hypothetical protein
VFVDALYLQDISIDSARWPFLRLLWSNATWRWRRRLVREPELQMIARPGLAVADLMRQLAQAEYHIGQLQAALRSAEERALVAEQSALTRSMIRRPKPHARAE